MTLYKKNSYYLSNYLLGRFKVGLGIFIFILNDRVDRYFLVDCFLK